MAILFKFQKLQIKTKEKSIFYNWTAESPLFLTHASVPAIEPANTITFRHPFATNTLTQTQYIIIVSSNYIHTYLLNDTIS